MEDSGIEYYQATSSKLTTDLSSENKKIQKIETKRIKRRQIKNKKRTIKEEDDVEKEDENMEVDEENPNKIMANSRKEYLHRTERFQQMVGELDNCMDQAFGKYYKSILEEFDRLLNAPSETSDLIPTLIIRGQCIQWNQLYKTLERKHQDIVIINAMEDTDINEICNEHEEEKLLIFLHANLYSTATFKHIFSAIEDRGLSYLVIYTPTTFGFIYERLSRQITIRMHISKAIFPPCSGFIHFLFDEQIPLGFLRQNCILFHGRTLAIAQQYFQCESRSLTNLRKILVLALHDFSINNEIELGNEEKKTFCETMGLYSALLRGFADISNEDTFSMHINIQNDPLYFASSYEKIKKQWAKITKDEWRFKFKELNELMQNLFIPEEIKIEYEKLSEALNKEVTEDDAENNPPRPKQKTSISNAPSTSAANSSWPTRLRKSAIPKTAAFIAEQEQKRAKMQNPLPEQLRNEIIAFMDKLFVIGPLPTKYIAGPGDITLNFVTDDQ